MCSVEAAAARLLFSLLMRNGWWDISVLLCQERDVGDFLFLIRNCSRFQLGSLVRLRLQPSSSSSSSSSGASAPQVDQQQVLLQQLEALREPSSTVALVTFGCDIREVRRLWTLAARLMLPEFHWVLGDSQNVAELRTEGLPLGLLAHGLMGSPSLDHYVHDSVELVARAVGTAALRNAPLALSPGTTNCMDEQHNRGGSGEYLAR